MEGKSAAEQGVAAPPGPAEPVVGGREVDERLAARPVDQRPEEEPAEDDERAAPAGPGPTLVLRPQLVWRLLGPALILLAMALVAVGRLRAVPVAFVLAASGAALLPAWRDRVEVGEATIVKRAWRGR